MYLHNRETLTYSITTGHKHTTAAISTLTSHIFQIRLTDICLHKPYTLTALFQNGQKPNMSTPGALSPTGELIQGVEIPPVAKSRGPKSNALAYAERALST